MIRSRAIAALAALLCASDAFANVFVLPHVLEQSGLVTNTPFTFDTSFQIEYTGGLAGCPSGVFCAYVDLYVYDETTGSPLQFPGDPRVCAPCNVFLDVGPEKTTLVLDDLVAARGGFPDSSVVFAFALAVVGGDDPSGVSISGFVTNSHASPFDLSVFGFEPLPLVPAAAFAALAAEPPALGASRVLTDVREDQGTVATTDGAYDTTISIFYLDAWFGGNPPAAGVTIDFFNSNGSPMLDANGDPYSYTIADLSLLPQPLILDLETPLFGGAAPGAPGKRGYATVNVTGALPERVDVTSFVRKRVTGPSDLDPDGFYEQALPAPEANDGALAAAATLAAVAVRKQKSAS